MPETKTNFAINELVALFLAEVIRSRRTSLRRAAEIARYVVANIQRIRTEEEALSLLTEVEKDFEEVVTLKQVLHFGYHKSSVKIYEEDIKEYAARIFVKDMVLSSSFLQDAAKNGMTIQELCLRYPDFSNYLFRSSERAELISDFGPVMQAAV